jgi:predicted O-methyltransferase YrrM
MTGVTVAERLNAHLAEAYERGSVHTRAGDVIELSPHSIEREQGEALRELAVTEGAARTIEVGLALGMSALFLCQAVLTRGGSHVAIDPFQGSSWGGAGILTLEEAGVREHVELIEEESQLALPRLVSEERTFDLAFVDGDHRFESALIDLYFMTRLVRPEGLIVMDDMWMPSIRTAVAYAEGNLGLELEPDAVPNAFRWRRQMWRRGVPRGAGGLAVLRCPAEPPELRWDAFVPPY